MKQFRRNIADIEAGAYRTAAEVLLIGLRHIKSHEMSHPITLTWEEWDKIVDELIWLCEFIVEDKWVENIEDHDRYQTAQKLLGEYFSQIWC